VIIETVPLIKLKKIDNKIILFQILYVLIKRHVICEDYYNFAAVEYSHKNNVNRFKNKSTVANYKKVIVLAVISVYQQIKFENISHFISVVIT